MRVPQVAREVVAGGRLVREALVGGVVRPQVALVDLRREEPRRLEVEHRDAALVELGVARRDLAAVVPRRRVGPRRDGLVAEEEPVPEHERPVLAHALGHRVHAVLLGEVDRERREVGARRAVALLAQHPPI